LVEVICDTSFLIHLSTRRIKNIDSVNAEIGQIQFVVPSAVLNELRKLSKTQKKKQDAITTLEFARNLKTTQMSGKFADQAIIEHVRKRGGIIATIDNELKNKIKKLGGSVMSFSNDKIVLES
jgi:rRNA-processing protein FCF1